MLMRAELERGGAKRLLTSAGKYGYFVSDLRLDFDPRTHRLFAQHARNVPMIRQGGGETRRSPRWLSAMPKRSRRSPTG